MRFLLVFTFCTSFSPTLAQDHSFPYGQINLTHFNLAVPAGDSSAVAIVLNEFGEAYISNDDSHNLIFEHHYIIKILKQSGVSEANIEIPLFRSGEEFERLLSVKACSYNIENGSVHQLTLNSKNVFTENYSKYLDHKKFTIPNVHEGSIIEVFYTLESPFFARNFRQWEFQSHLPKLVSEYWATIPGYYNYNISWKGYLKLTKNEGEIIKGCFSAGGYNADCARYKFGMKNIPAFVEEDYMTAKSNFLASVNFELLEVKHFNGRTDKITNEWKDADEEMKRDPNFGAQIKKGKDISLKIEPLLTGITDSLEQAKKIYDFIRTWYSWNEYYGKYSSSIKKAFEAKTGSIGDINLSLIAALRSSNFDVESLVLSTRDNGLPTELFPVLSDFNYVVAKLNLNGKTFLLDASDPFLSFGMLPERCLNGKGRVFADKQPSYWHDLKPTEKYKRVTVLTLTLEPTGIFKGTIQYRYEGYHAFEKRKQIAASGNQEEYLQELKKDLPHVTINKYEVTETKDFADPIIEKLEVEIEGFDNLNSANFLLNPFFTGKIESNPFRSNERLFPIDFGAPRETTIVLNLSYPPSIELESAPENAALTLPNSGGKFMFNVTPMENRLTISYLFSINKSVFNSAEYHYLKELYDRVIQTQQTDLIFQRKK